MEDWSIIFSSFLEIKMRIRHSLQPNSSNGSHSCPFPFQSPTLPIKCIAWPKWVGTKVRGGGVHHGQIDKLVNNVNKQWRLQQEKFISMAPVPQAQLKISLVYNIQFQASCHESYFWQNLDPYLWSGVWGVNCPRVHEFGFKLPTELQRLVVNIEINAVHIPSNTYLQDCRESKTKGLW